MQEKRQAEAARIRDKYPDRIPVRHHQMVEVSRVVQAAQSRGRFC